MVRRSYVPDRGDFVWVDLDPVKGHEEKGRRPAFVISMKSYNGRSGLALLCPITSRGKGYPFEVVLQPGRVEGVILVDQLRSVDWKERHARFIAITEVHTIADASEKLALLVT